MYLWWYASGGRPASMALTLYSSLLMVPSPSWSRRGATYNESYPVGTSLRRCSLSTTYDRPTPTSHSKNRWSEASNKRVYAS